MTRNRSHRLTISDIAQMAGVSKTTVSRVLNERPDVDADTRARIKALLVETGFSRSPVATALAGGAVRSIGVVFPHVSTSWTSEILLGIGETARQAGFDLMLWTVGHTGFSGNRLLTYLHSGLIAGAVVVLPHDSQGSELEEVVREGFPLVAVDYGGSVTNVPVIQVENRAGLELAMAHLLDLGHRRIAFLKGNPAYGCSQDRLEGYTASLAAYGIAADPKLIVDGDFSEEKGFEATSALMRRERPPTAIVAGNDLSAIGALRAVKSLGLSVPGDVSIVGFDDIPGARHTDPPLTTVHQPMQAMGKMAASMIIDFLTGKRKKLASVELPTELIVRQSTASPPPLRSAPPIRLAGGEP